MTYRCIWQSLQKRYIALRLKDSLVEYNQNEDSQTDCTVCDVEDGFEKPKRLAA